MRSYINGQEVASEVLQWIGYRTQLSRAIVISYNMQDYDFWGGGALSHLLLRQLAMGASVTVITTPPPGRATKKPFKEKYELLHQLDAKGVDVQLNEQLHAKAYVFQTTRGEQATIVGSANLTSRGFGDRSTPNTDLVEMSFVTFDRALYDEACAFATHEIGNHAQTIPYATWLSLKSSEIGKANT